MNKKNYLRLLKSGIATATFLTSTLGAAPLTLSAETFGEEEIELGTIVSETDTIVDPVVAMDEVTPYMDIVDIWFSHDTYQHNQDIELYVELESRIPVEYAKFTYTSEKGEEAVFVIDYFANNGITDDDISQYYGESFYDITADIHEDLEDQTFRLSEVLIRDDKGNEFRNEDFASITLNSQRPFMVSDTYVPEDESNYDENEELANIEVLEVNLDEDSYYPGDMLEVTARFASDTPFDIARVVYTSDYGEQLLLDLHILHEESEGIYFGRGEMGIATNDTDSYYRFSHIHFENQNGYSYQINNDDLESIFYMHGYSSIDNKLNESLLDLRKINSKNSYQQDDFVEFEVELDSNTEIESLRLEFNGNRFNNSLMPMVTIDDLVQNDNGNYIGRGIFKIKPFMPNDIYDIFSISGTDSDGINHYYDGVYTESKVYDDISFEITNSLLPDEFNPIVKEINIDKERINYGEEFEVEILVQSDTFVDRVVLEVESVHPGGLEWVIIENLEKISEGLYSGKGLFRPYFGAGTYIINHGTVYDAFMTPSKIDSSVLDLEFHVSEPLLADGPIIENITFEDKVYLSGEEVEFEVTVKHEYPLNTVYLEFESELYEGEYNPGLSIYSFTEDEAGNYVGKGYLRLDDIDFSSNDIASFNLITGYLSDIYENETLMNQSDFEIEVSFTENTDKEGPKLHDLRFDKDSYYIGDTVTVEVEVSDITDIYGVIMALGTTNIGDAVYQDIFIMEGLKDTFTQNKITGHYSGVIQFKLDIFLHDYFNLIDDNVYLSSLYLLDSFYNESRYDYLEIEDISKDNIPSFKVKALKVVEDTRVNETPFKTEIKYNPELSAGTKKVVQSGVVGMETKVEEVTYGFGIEIKREVLSDEKVEPVNEIIEIGTKAATIEDNTIKKVVDKETGIAVAVKGSDKVLNLVAQEIKKDSVDNSDNVIFEKPEAKKAIETLGEEYAIFDIHLSNPDGTEVNPEDSVKVTIPYTSEFKPEKLYHFGDDFEAITELEFTDNGDSLEFEVSKFSYFGIQFALAADVEEPETPEIPETPGSPDTPIEVDEVVEDTNVTEEVETQTSSTTSDETVTEIAITDSKDNEELPATGEALPTATALIGTLFTTMGLAIGFKKRKK